MITSSTAQELLTEVLARHGTIDAFFAHLRDVPDPPTDRLPVCVPVPSGGRHRRREGGSGTTVPIPRCA